MLHKTAASLLSFLIFILICRPAAAEQYKQIVVATGSPFELGLVSVEKHSNLRYNHEWAVKFYDFLVSDTGQQLIANFGVKEYGEPIYYPYAKK